MGADRVWVAARAGPYGHDGTDRFAHNPFGYTARKGFRLAAADVSRDYDEVGFEFLLDADDCNRRVAGSRNNLIAEVVEMVLADSHQSFLGDSLNCDASVDLGLGQARTHGREYMQNVHRRAREPSQFPGRLQSLQRVFIEIDRAENNSK